ncbi:MAG TPA: O-antigen ligase family protein, partial [Patescibacteria group bacterium]|nr:O-antigen ligase family protein [Patescibacteria group bacterium]
ASLFCIFLDTTLTRRTKQAIFLLLVVIFGAFLLLEVDNTKWSSLTLLEERSSLTSRVMIWQAAAKMIGEHPLLGIGVGRFQAVYLEYQQYFPPYLEWAVPQPHNMFLAVWLQTGILGLASFVFLVGHTFFLLLRETKKETPALLGLLVLYLVCGIVDTPYFKTDQVFAFWVLIALIFSHSEEGAPTQASTVQ